MEQDYLVDDGQVERLHGLLAEALRRSRSDPFGAPVTVAEIYQDLVPYRTVRTSLGFHMNADYEHTLLRLLAGEGGLARLDPAEARDELRAELDTPNPNVGLFRKFAACDVWITAVEVAEPLPAFEERPAPAATAPVPPPRPAPPPVTPTPVSSAVAPPAAPAVNVAATPPASAPPPEPPARVSDVEQWRKTGVSGAAPPAASEMEWDGMEAELLLEEEVETTDTPEEAAALPTPATDQPEAATMFEAKTAKSLVAEPGHAGSCVFCHGALPASRKVRFCPHCGMDQSMHPCGTCNEPLEAAWKYCISCGAVQS